MILQKKNIHMVKVYDNIIPSLTCKRLLDLFEKNTEFPSDTSLEVLKL